MNLALLESKLCHSVLRPEIIQNIKQFIWIKINFLKTSAKPIYSYSRSALISWFYCNFYFTHKGSVDTSLRLFDIIHVILQVFPKTCQASHISCETGSIFIHLGISFQMEFILCIIFHMKWMFEYMKIFNLPTTILSVLLQPASSFHGKNYMKFACS